MERQNTTLIPTAMEVINQVSGAYSAPFWDGLLAVTEGQHTRLFLYSFRLLPLPLSMFTKGRISHKELPGSGKGYSWRNR